MMMFKNRMTPCRLRKLRMKVGGVHEDSQHVGSKRRLVLQEGESNSKNKWLKVADGYMEAAILEMRVDQMEMANPDSWDLWE